MTDIPVFPTISLLVEIAMNSCIRGKQSGATKHLNVGAAIAPNPTYFTFIDANGSNGSVLFNYWGQCMSR